MAATCIQCGESESRDDGESPNDEADPDGDAGAGDSSTSNGCGREATRPDPDVQQTITIDGTTRYYLLDVPEDADSETPLMLIIALHGYDMNNVAVVDQFNFTSRSKGTAITAYPQGEGPPPGDEEHWGDQVLKSTWASNEANYAFIRALKEELLGRFCIDENRVFLTGFSMGGFFTNSLACKHNDWFRAYAPVAGGVPETCEDPDAESAIMVIHGSEDNIVDPEVGENSRDFWVTQNGCEETRTESYSGCETNDGCPDAKPVTYCVGAWDHWVHPTATGNIWEFFSGLK